MSGKSEQELAILIAGKVENSLKKSLGTTEEGLNKIANVAVKAAGIIGTAFAAIKIGEFIGDAVSEYSEFEQSMANTAAIAGASSSEYKQLSDAAREAGKATTFTASEAADALGYMALAGWDVNTSTAALTPVLKLAEATQADLATTSDQVTDSMSAMGVGIDELQEYLDVVVMTNNKAKTTSSELMEAFIGCGGAARASGMNFKETATALGILANNGIKGAEAGTALNSMLVRISTKDSAQAAFRELGVSVYDSSGQMRSMKDILVDLNGAMSNMTDEQKNNYMATIAGTNYYSQFGYLLEGVKDGVDGASSAWDGLRENLENSNGALDKMDAAVTNTMKGSIARFQSAISDLKISMVEDFGPYAIVIIDNVAEAIPKITKNLTSMIKKMPVGDFMNSVGNMAGAVFDFLESISSGNGVVESISSVMQSHFGVQMPESVGNAIQVVTDFIDKGKEAVSFIINNVITAIDNVKDTIANNEPAINKVIEVVNDLKDKLFEAFENAKPTISFISETALPAVTDALLKVLGGVADVTDAFIKWDGFLPTITAIGIAVGAVKFYQLVTGIYSAAKAMALLNIAKIKDMALTAAINYLYIEEAVLKAASTVQTWAMTAAEWAWNAAAGVGATVTTALATAIAFLTSPIGLVILAIGAIIAIGVLLWQNWDMVKEKAGQLGSWIGEKFNAMKEAITNAVEGFKNQFPVAFAFIKGVFDGFMATVTGIIEGVKQVFQGIIDFVKGVFTGDWKTALDGLKNIFQGTFKVLGSIAMAPLNALKGIVTGAFNAIDTATGGKLTAMKDKAVEVWGNIQSTAAGAWEGIKNTAGTVLQAARDTVSEKLNNIKAAYEENGGGITGAAAAVMEGVKGYFTAGLTFIDNLTGGKLSTVASYFTEKLEAAKSTVTGILDGIKQGFSEKLEAAKTIVSGAIDAIKGFFKFDWELPKLKLPHFSITGEFSVNPPKVPSFGVQWYKEGGIMTNPTMFGINGSNAMVGGEAGAEAILPLSTLWDKLGMFIDSAMNNQNGIFGSAIKVLAERIDAFMAGTQKTPVAALSTEMSEMNYPPRGYGNEGNVPGINITYAPVYRFEGAAPAKADLMQAEKISQSEFDRMMKQWQKDQGRLKY